MSTQKQPPDPTVPTASIVLIGNELLSGKVADINGAYLVRELRDLGVELQGFHILPDNVERISELVRIEAKRYDYVFTSGGIGPTHDDRTLAALAQAFDVELIHNQTLDELIRRHFGTDARKLQAWMKMASIPEECCLLYNSGAIWPLFVMHNVYAMPGIPELFQAHFKGIRDRFKSKRFYARTIYFRGGEGDLADELSRGASDHPHVWFGSYPVLGVSEYQVRVTLESKERQAIVDAFQWLIGRVDRRQVYKVVDD